MEKAIPVNVQLGCASNRVAATISNIKGRDKADTVSQKIAMFKAWISEKGYTPQVIELA